jgi:agmatinase
MQEAKLRALRAKYAERGIEVCDDPVNRTAAANASGMYFGLRTLVDAPHQEGLAGLDLALIGIPFDRGVVHRPGARFGPKAIRDMTMFVGPLNHQTRVNPFALCRIADVGDVPLPTYSLDEGIALIEAYYHRVLDAGVAPISAGGDHSVTYPILKALGRNRPVGLVHIDAHCDTAGALDGSKFHHGGPFRNAVLAGVLDPERTIQIGIRGAAEPYWEFSCESGMTVVPIQDFHRLGVDAVIEKARAVVAVGPTYVSFDVDGLDPAYAPGTGTPETGGLSTREAIQLLRGLRGLDVVGGDVVEVAPEYDTTSNTAQVGKQMLFEILCLAAEARRARGA